MGLSGLVGGGNHRVRARLCSLGDAEHRLAGHARLHAYYLNAGCQVVGRKRGKPQPGGTPQSFTLLEKSVRDGGEEKTPAPPWLYGSGRTPWGAAVHGQRRPAALWAIPRRSPGRGTRGCRRLSSTFVDLSTAKVWARHHPRGPRPDHPQRETLSVAEQTSARSSPRADPNSQPGSGSAPGRGGNRPSRGRLPLPHPTL